MRCSRRCWSSIHILDDLLKTAERDFDAAVKHAASIDDTAQKTSGLAGLFLAAAFGFVQPESLATLREQYGNAGLGLLYLALSLFVATVVLYLRYMAERRSGKRGIARSQERNRRKCPRSFYSSLRTPNSTRR